MTSAHDSFLDARVFVVVDYGHRQTRLVVRTLVTQGCVVVNHDGYGDYRQAS
ncbi:MULTISPECIES: hypothetical protein [Microbacterium]|uniref:hypothetical protein n=1 Tax=Microbacterium TaxID=33882 RepID=UPI0034399A83